MKKCILFFWVLLISVFCFSQNKKIKKGKLTNEAVKIVNNRPLKPLSTSEYHSLLGKGMDVDWAKTSEGIRTYNGKMVKDFKSKGLGHVRIRIKNKADDKLLKHLDRIVGDCLSENLIPIIAYQGAEFKGKPTEQNLQNVVDWWALISKHAQHYSPLVSFDLIIEVTEALNKEPETLNNLYEKTVTTIRKTNPTRIVFISPIVRSAPENLKLLKIPSQHNGYLMAEWHFYASGPDKENPLKKWTTGTEAEKKLVRDKIKLALDWQKQSGILTWVGAWMPGNYNKGNQYSVKEQIEFSRFVVCELTRNKIPFAFNSDVKFYERNKLKWVEAMMPVLDEILSVQCK